MIRPVGDLGLYLAGADAFPDYEARGRGSATTTASGATS